MNVLGAIVQRSASIAPLRWILRLAVRVLAPRHYVGAVGAVVNDEGKVLVAKHAYRTDFPWGLPGGWVNAGESPADAVRREIAEELKLDVTIERLLLCDVIPSVARSIAPRHLGVAFLCRLAGGEIRMSGEIVGVDWIDPAANPYELAHFQASAVAAAARAIRPSGKT